MLRGAECWRIIERILGFVSKTVAEVAKTSGKPRNSELLASSATKKRSSHSVLRQSLITSPSVFGESDAK